MMSIEREIDRESLERCFEEREYIQRKYDERENHREKNHSIRWAYMIIRGDTKIKKVIDKLY